MDAVVAAMQRLKQLHAQAAGQLAAGQGASGVAAAALALRVPPLFAGSQVGPGAVAFAFTHQNYGLSPEYLVQYVQYLLLLLARPCLFSNCPPLRSHTMPQAATKRGELVSDLLAYGPSLTAQPEAVCPESWADLLAAGRGSATAGAATPPPATTRRLSNPVQEARNFAAEGMAADADALTVHSVLVRRLAAAGAALQTASGQSGTAAGSAEARAALAEAAACRGAFLLLVWVAVAFLLWCVQADERIELLQCIEPVHLWHCLRRKPHAQRAAGTRGSSCAR